MIIEAIAWIKKYLIAISKEELFNLLIRIGVKLIKLSSNPIHAISQEEEEQAIIVPIIKDIIKMKWCVLIKIKEGKIYNFHRRGMNPIAYLAYLFKKKWFRI